MRIHFFSRPIRFSSPLLRGSLSFFLLLLATGCYSVEFHPRPDYPNLMRSGIDRDSVELRTTQPERPIDVLGEMVIRDFSGDIYDRDFRQLVRYEASKRGAGGAWIIRRRIQETESFRTESVDTTPGPGEGRLPTGHINKDVGIVHIILYNYKEIPGRP